MLQPARARTRTLRRIVIALAAAATGALVIATAGIGAPSNTVLPTVSGIFQDGGTLAVNPGTWTAGPDVDYAYQWQNCPSYASTILQDSPTAYWRMGEQSGTTLADATGHGNTGTLTSTTLGQTGVLAGDPDTSIGFFINAGDQNWATLAGTYPTARAAATLEAWVKPNALAGSQPVIGYGASSGTGSSQFFLFLNGARPAISYGGSTMNGNTTLQVGQWYHLAAVDDGTKLHIYVNGVEDGLAVTPANGFSKANGQAQIGRWPPGNANTAYLQGWVDEAAIYGSGLTGTRLVAHYQAGTSVTGTGCASIASATDPTYVLQPSDVNRRVGVVVTATDSTGSGSATSAATMIAPAGPTAPTAPVVTGTPELGQTLTGTEGTWDGIAFSPTQPTYQWQRCGMQAVVLRDHPLSYYRLGEANGTSAADLGSLNLAGTYIGSPDMSKVGALVGDKNTAVKLDGSTEYVSLSGSYPTGRQQVTLEAWVNPGNNGAAKEYVVGYGDTTASDLHGFAIYWDKTNSVFGIETKRSADVFEGATAVSQLQWYHVVATDDGTKLHLYVNGQQDGQWSTSTLTKANGVAQIGRFSGQDPTGSYFTGTVDDVAIYGSALNTTQVSEHYHAGADELSGSGCTDIAGATGTFDQLAETSSYTVTAADTGYKLREKVLALNADSGGVPTEADSNMVSVTSAAPSLALPPAISGSTATGATLTTTAGTWAGTQPITPSYQWNTCTYASTILGDTPGGYWRLDDSPNQLAVADATTHANIGTSTKSPAIAQALFGTPGALSNDGDTAVNFAAGTTISIPDSPTLDGTTSYTVELWVAPNSITPPTGGDTIASQGDGSTTGWKLSYAGGTGFVTFSVKGSSVTSNVGLVDPTKWYYVVGLVGSNGVKLYVNNVLQGTATAPTVTAANSPINLGSSSLRMDEAAYYQRNLGTTTIGTHFSAAGCQQIAGATAATHVVTAADSGKALSVTISAQNGLGTTTASTPEKAISGSAAPANTVRPVVTGDPSVGSQLSTDNGSWDSPATPTYQYQWQRCAYGAAILANAPIGYWPVDEIGGPAIADLSGNNLATTSTGVQFGLDGALADSADTGIRLGSAGSGLSVADASTLALSNTFTLEAWARLTDATNTGVIFDEGRTINSAGNSTYGYKLQIAGGKLQLATGGTAVATATASFPTDGHYHYLVATDDGAGHVTLYQDGVSVASVSSAPNIPNVASALGIGMTSILDQTNKQSLTHAFDGDLDELAIYGAPLTATQVTAHYNAAQTACSTISGATSSQYTLASGDVGAQVRVKVTATNASGSASAVSSGLYVPASAPVSTLEPVDGATVGSVTPLLSRAAVSGTNPSYQFQIAENGNFSQTVENNGTTTFPETSAWLSANSYSVPASWNLADSKTYYWRARSRVNGVVSTWMGPNRITTTLAKLGAGPTSYTYGPLTVNLVTGNLTFTAPTPSYPSVAGSLGMSLVYNSLDASSQPLGRGWKSDAGPAFTDPPTITELPPANGQQSVKVQYASGLTEIFNRVPTGDTFSTSEFSKPAGSNDTLTEGPGRNYDFTDSAGGHWGTVPEDAQGNAPVWTYEPPASQPGSSTATEQRSGSNVQSISDGAGKSLTFNWTGCTGVCVTGPDGVTWSYSKNGSGQLATIGDGTRTLYAFSYDANGRLSKIQNADDLDPTHASAGYNATHSIQIAYDGSGRVSSISEGPITGQTPSTATSTFDYHPGDVQTDGTRNAHVLQPDGYPWDAGYTGKTTTLALGATRTAAGYTNVTTPLEQGSGQTTRYYYDGLDRTIEFVDANGHNSQTGFDSKSHTVWTEDAAGNPTDYTFDQVTDVLLSTKNALGYVSKTYYDEQAVGTGGNPGLAMQGLKGSYQNLAGGGDNAQADAIRTDPTIDFNWASTGPQIIPGAGIQFKATWTGVLSVPTTGAYTFSTDTNGSVALTIDNRSVISASPSNFSTVSSEAIALKAGRHTIQFEFQPTIKPAIVSLRWKCACGVPSQLIPTANLAPAYNLATSTVSATGHVEFTHYANPGVGRSDYSLIPLAGGTKLITSQTYDAAGDILRSVSGRGNAGRAIDASGNLTGEADPAYTTVYTYFDKAAKAAPPAVCGGGSAVHQYGQLASMTVPGRASVTHVYDVSGREIAVSNGAGTVCKTFDAEGRMTATTDADGRTSSSTYDPNANALTVTAANGGVSANKYDEAGHVLAKTDPNGHTTSFTHDAAGDVLTTAQPAGGTTSSTYDKAGNRLTHVDALNRTTQYGYDAMNRATSMTSPLLRHAKRVYDAAGHLTSETDFRGKTTTYSYGADGNRVGVTDALNHTATISYDNANRVATETDANGHATTYGYDLDGNKKTVTVPDGGVTTTIFSADGNPTSVTDPLGHVTTSKYDGAGRLVSTTTPGGRTTKFTYDGVGNKLTQTDGTGNKTLFAYNGLDKVVWETFPLGERTLVGYDLVGNMTSQTDGRGKVTTYEYDAANRLTATVAPLGGRATKVYDLAGQLTSETDPMSHTTAYEYDADGNRTKVTAPDGGVTTLGYNANGDLTTRTDANIHTTTYTYDALSRLSTQTDALGRTTTHTYDNVGNEVSLLDGNNRTTTRTYDAMNRLLSITYPAGTHGVAYTYDLAGNKTTMVDGSGTETYTYNPDNQMISATRAGRGFAYTYDSVGRIATRTLVDGTQTTYVYDADGRMTSATTGATAIHYGYDAAGNVTSTQFPNGWTEQRSYDDNERVIDIHSVNGASTLGASAYTRDANGNPTTIVRDGVSENYTYDASNRVTAVCYGGAVAGCAAASLIQYSYDHVGNRLTQNRFGQATTYAYDQADELTGTTGAGAATFAYDANGNQTQSGSTTYTFDGSNHLIRVDRNGTTAATYAYDGAGNRITVASGGTTTTDAWDENADLPQLGVEAVAGSPVRRYIYALGVAAFKTSSGTFYLHRDDIGSTVAFTGATGSIETTYKYDPYGQLRSSTNVDPTAPANSIEFAGQLFDSNVGLYDVRARQYDPNLGDFLSEDPLAEALSGPDTSVYNYVSDNPTVLVDPSGQTEEESAEFGGAPVGDGAPSEGAGGDESAPGEDSNGNSDDDEQGNNERRNKKASGGKKQKKRRKQQNRTLEPPDGLTEQERINWEDGVKNRGEDPNEFNVETVGAQTSRYDQWDLMKPAETDGQLRMDSENKRPGWRPASLHIDLQEKSRLRGVLKDDRWEWDWELQEWNPKLPKQVVRLIAPKYRQTMVKVYNRLGLVNAPPFLIP